MFYTWAAKEKFFKSRAITTMKFQISLLGSLPKGDKIRKTWKDWKKEYKEKLARIEDVEFIDGDEWKDETRPLELVGHDLSMIKNADLVIVNAENKLGAGTAQEIVVAKYFKKPVISVLPKNFHHRRSGVVFNGVKIDDWIHPFILTFSDTVVEDIEACVRWIEKFRKSPNETKVKDITIIDQAIEAYLRDSHQA